MDVGYAVNEIPKKEIYEINGVPHCAVKIKDVEAVSRCVYLYLSTILNGRRISSIRATTPE